MTTTTFGVAFNCCNQRRGGEAFLKNWDDFRTVEGGERESVELISFALYSLNKLDWFFRYAMENESEMPTL